MKYDIILAPDAVEDFKELKAHERAKVRDALDIHLRTNPGRVSRSRIKRLRGLSKPQYRLRVDDLRVYYDIVNDRVEVIAIIMKHRADEWLEKEGKQS